MLQCLLHCNADHLFLLKTIGSAKGWATSACLQTISQVYRSERQECVPHQCDDGNRQRGGNRVRGVRQGEITEESCFVGARMLVSAVLRVGQGEITEESCFVGARMQITAVLRVGQGRVN
eukprot:1156583-Pelagomonas_calceolata.AAC.2